MAKQPNMKIGIGADTSDFEKGAKQVKQGLKDLSKTGTDAISSLGEAFGVNTGKIGQMTSAITGLGQKMSECGNTGVAAFGNILKSIGPVGGAIAGLGIAAATAAFKALKDEATAFKQTVEGANIEMATAAYVSTYQQVLRDFRGELGKNVAESESGITKWFRTIGANMKAFFSSGTMLPGATSAGLQTFLTQTAEANKKAEEAERITNEIYRLERRRKENTVELARLNDQIADQMLIARDASLSTSDRQAAIEAVETLIAQKKTMTVDLERELASLYRERSNLATDTVDAADATLAQEARQYDVERAITQEETAMLRIKNSIGKASDAEIARMNKLLEQQKELQAAIDATRAKWSGMNEGLAGLSGVGTPTFPGVTAPTLNVLPRVENAEYFSEVLNAQLGDIRVGIGLEADTEKIRDITNEVNSLIESGVQRTSELIGNLIGTLAAGGDAWGDFKNAALSAFGDMAIAVGKIAVAAGVATLGIKAAFESMNGYAAIAAGAALIALGSAVKSSLSAVASGDYSAAGGGYSGASGYSSSGGGYETREVTVNVTGTLEADGDKLITVLNNTNKRNYYTR